MEAITVYPKNLEEVKLLKSMLEKMKISFSKAKDTEGDFIFTEEMKKTCDKALLQDKSTYRDADEVMAELGAKYGL